MRNPAGARKRRAEAVGDIHDGDRRLLLFRQDYPLSDVLCNPVNASNA